MENENKDKSPEPTTPEIDPEYTEEFAASCLVLLKTARKRQSESTIASTEDKLEEPSSSKKKKESAPVESEKPDQNSAYTAGSDENSDKKRLINP